MNPEQFALAMWLINRKQSGRDPPAALTPDMVPPSMRPKGQDAVSQTILPLNPCQEEDKKNNMDNIFYPNENIFNSLGNRKQCLQ